MEEYFKPQQVFPLFLDMETDSLPGDVESLRGGLSLLDPLVDRILGDAVSQQQGWLRVYGKKITLRSEAGPRSAGSEGTGARTESQVSAEGPNRGHRGHRGGAFQPRGLPRPLVSPVPLQRGQRSFRGVQAGWQPSVCETLKSLWFW